MNTVVLKKSYFSGSFAEWGQIEALSHCTGKLVHYFFLGPLRN